MTLCHRGNCHMHLSSTLALLKFTHPPCLKILSCSAPDVVTVATEVSLSPAVAGATTAAGVSHGREQACWWSWEFMCVSTHLLISAAGAVKGTSMGPH